MRNKQKTKQQVWAQNAADTLYRGFIWSDTIEGIAFWRAVARRLGTFAETGKVEEDDNSSY